MSKNSNERKANGKKYSIVIKYIIIGGIATIIDFFIFLVLANIFNVYYILANSISFSIGLLFNYFTSREWVFEKKHHNFKRDFTLYTITSILGLIINNLIVYTLIHFELLRIFVNMFIKFENEDVMKFAAKFIATIVVLVWNFVTKKYYVFKE